MGRLESSTARESVLPTPNNFASAQLLKHCVLEALNFEVDLINNLKHSGPSGAIIYSGVRRLAITRYGVFRDIVQMRRQLVRYIGSTTSTLVVVQ